MGAYKKIDILVKKHGYSDYKWIEPKNIIVAQWVRMKCTFGCDEFGKSAACPPNVPSVLESKQFFNEYNNGIILHFKQKFKHPKDRFQWTKEINKKLLKLERDIFCCGYPKTFLLFMDTCILCKECAGEREKCKKPKWNRITLIRPLFWLCPVPSGLFRRPRS